MLILAAETRRVAQHPARIPHVNTLWQRVRTAREEELPDCDLDPEAFGSVRFVGLEPHIDCARVEMLTGVKSTF